MNVHRVDNASTAHRRWSLAIAVLLLVPAGVGCQEGKANPLPPRPPSLPITMREFSLDIPPKIGAGRVVLQAQNVGKRPHRLLLLALPEDFPPILEQFRGSQRRQARPLAAVSRTFPGRSRATAVDLVPGRYALFCPITGPDGVSYASKGMAAEFRVGKAPRGTRS